MQRTMNQPSTYSREVEEILSRKPSFFIRNGMLLLFILFILLLAGISFIPYPEQMRVEVTLLQHPDSTTGRLCGKILLPVAATSVIRVNDSLSFFWHPAGTSKEERTTGTIETILLIRGSTHSEINLLFCSRKIPPGTTGTVIVVTGQSTVLRHMLNPILSLFRYD